MVDGTLIVTLAVMNSGKTARLIEENFNYQRIGRKTMVFKPSLDTREENIIKSRNGMSVECHILNTVEDLNKAKEADIILIDEVQFLSADIIDSLREIALTKQVFCFGLKTDFRGNLFEGSKRLIEVADSIKELSTLCLCGCKATMNIRYDSKSGNIVKSGNVVDCGYEDKYLSVCYKHFNFKNIKDISRD